ncbi:uncharacterized protein LOC128277781 [Anopheles cruzii]|uniref:uncharacterized protein LOC128277781 n=1 Tax=Anopheles cruzii TaxID=68878 RepID=UPI0022EC1A12|nr:uncharacterized protein LOC128277781 [Anopheles cruzii]
MKRPTNLKGATVERRRGAHLNMLDTVPGRRLYERVRHLVELPVRQNETGLGERDDGQQEEEDEGGEDGSDQDDDGFRKPIELTIEAKAVTSRQRHAEGADQPEGNWMEQFLRRTSTERIRWQTKYYRTDRKLLDKPLFQQIEELIDLGAQDFAEWLNGLGAEKSNITRDIIKQLFSIEIEEEIARAIRVDAREVRAIPTEAARDWHLEHMALEERIAQVMRADQLVEGRAAAARHGRVAFGRTLPRELQGPRGRNATDQDVHGIVPDFPNDLRTLKTLFQDIRHLRSVRYLVEHLAAQADIQRPRYLVEQGLFAAPAPPTSRTGSEPFYRTVLTTKQVLDSVLRH